MWHNDEQANSPWLASLEDTHSRKITHFASIEELGRFLSEQVATPDIKQDNPRDSQEKEQ